MKNFKKVLACVMAISTISCIPTILTSADDSNTQWEYNYDNSNIVSKNDFGTVFEKNFTDVVDVEFTEEYTTYFFKDGTTYTINCLSDEPILSSQVEDVSEECYYLIGYTVSCFGHHGYNIGNWISNKPQTVTLPDGITLNVSEIPYCYDIQEVYNLDGKYMGYRIQYNGEDVIYSDIISIGDSDSTIGDSGTIGDSMVTALQGDVNLDGDVNGLDLLYLKKYLLGLINF